MENREREIDKCKNNIRFHKHMMTSYKNIRHTGDACFHDRCLSKEKARLDLLQQNDASIFGEFEKRLCQIDANSARKSAEAYRGALSNNVSAENLRVTRIKVWYHEEAQSLAEKAINMIDDPERFDIENNSYLIKKFLKTIEETNKTLSDCVKSMEPDENDRCRVATNAMMDFTSLYAKLLVKFGTEITWLEDGLE